MHRLFRACVLCLTAVAASGCASVNTARVPDQEMAAYLADKPAPFREDYRRILEEGKNNEGLNYLRLGLKASQRGSKEVAKASFDRALLGIETFYSDTDAAKKARSLWYEEGMKDFKGEPYERVMTYYYRGLLFLEDHDYENARAAFKSGVLQDSFAEEEQYRADFALVILLEGLASRLAGDPEAAKVAFAELKKLRPDFIVPDSSNLVIIAETGASPRKVADGPGHAELKYRRGRNFTEKRAEISLDAGASLQLYPMEDIYLQASTRGGRQIDKILKDKVVFRQTNLEIGSTLSNMASTAMVIAPLTNSMGTVQAVAGGLAIIGGVQQYIAINAKPHADTRYWDNLPDTVHIGFANLPPGPHKILFSFKDEKGNSVRELDKAIDFEIKDNAPLIVWAKSR